MRQFGNGSFLQIVGTRKTAFIAGRVLSVTAMNSTPEVISGELQLENIHEISHGLWKGGTQARVQYAQYRSQPRRIRSGGQGWNGVELRPGTNLVMAVCGSAPPYEAGAVTEIKTLDDPFVKELRYILSVEEEEEPERRVEAIRKAILNGAGLVTVYGHYAAGPLHRIGRREAADVELTVFENPSQPDDNRRAAATNLELQLWIFGDTDDSINRRILNAFFEVLPDAPDQLRSDLVDALTRLLFGNVPKEMTIAEQYRKKLRRTVSIDSEAAILHVLSERESRSESAAVKGDIKKLASWVSS